MENLFSQAQELNNEPLASRMRPRSIDEFIGQDHIMAPGRLLRRAIQADRLASVIFAGPPGTGKTTLAKVIANSTKSKFLSLNAVLSGVKELREAIAQAKDHKEFYGRKTILFVDEVHRWNKAQQDALLPWVENGTVILIGATTENPYFEVNKALVSRSRIFQLVPLEEHHLRLIAQQAMEDPNRGYGKYTIEVEPKALDHLIEVAGGDARTLLSALELAVETTPDSFPPEKNERIVINLAIAEESIQKRALLYDKEGDYHYDTISAFIKSIRGSDPDAALYWMARMLRSGEDPRFLFRRMLISASEDVGLADPQALGIVESAARAFDRVGMPEGQFFLSQAVLYLATAPKSNTTLGYFDAARAVEEEKRYDIPTHLKDNNRDHDGFGHGEGYLYPHAYRDHWVAQDYMPQSLKGRVFYTPSNEGHEAKVKEQVERRREIQLAAVLENPAGEILTFSPVNKKQEEWLTRTSSGISENLEKVRDLMMKDLETRRHYNVLVCEPSPGLLLWDIIRKTPEGHIIYCPPAGTNTEIMQNQLLKLDELQRPEIIRFMPEDFQQSRQGSLFEIILLRNVLFSNTDKPKTIENIAGLAAPSVKLEVCEIIPSMSTRLSQLLPDNTEFNELKKLMEAAEDAFYSNSQDPRFNWNFNDARSWFDTPCKFDATQIERIALKEERTISRANLTAWFHDAEGLYNSVVSQKTIHDETLKKAFNSLTSAPVLWQTNILHVSAKWKS